MSNKAAVRFRFLAGAIGLASLALATSASAAFPGHNGRIAFWASIGGGGHASIYTVNPDGLGGRRLTPVPSGGAKPQAYDPTVSANGKEIVFERASGSRNTNYDIFKMRSDGSHKVRLTHTKHTDEYQPSFSPSGHRIVFERYLPGPGFEIFTMKANGSHVRRLTNNRARDVDAEFSPSGKRI